LPPRTLSLYISNESKLKQSGNASWRRESLILFFILPFITTFDRNKMFMAMNSILRYGKTSCAELTITISVTSSTQAHTGFLDGR
jgi:hypothetical protein